MSNVETYMRGQVVWALWQFFSRHGSADPRRLSIPKPFATRARKMGEFGVPLSTKEKPGQPGIDVEYTAYQAFELAAALTLQNCGLKQAEVGFFVRNVRSQIRTCYNFIMANPPPVRDVASASAFPDRPTKMFVPGAEQKGLGLGDEMRRKLADTSVYMTFKFTEIREATNYRNTVHSDWKGKSAPPIFSVPLFHIGLLSLADELEREMFPPGDHMRFVVEVSRMAVMVTEYLREAPEITRGRS